MKYKNTYNYVNDSNSNEVIVILDDIEFAWRKKDIEKVISLWNGQYSIKNISKIIKREEDELFLLLLHLARNKAIKKRDNYIWGIN